MLDLPQREYTYDNGHAENDQYQDGSPIDRFRYL